MEWSGQKPGCSELKRRMRKQKQGGTFKNHDYGRGTALGGGLCGMNERLFVIVDMGRASHSRHEE